MILVKNAEMLIRRGFRSKLLRATSFLIASNWITMGISLIQSVVLARFLGAANYGLIILSITLVNTVLHFLDIRTSESLIKLIGIAISKNESKLSMTFFQIGLFVDVLIMLLSMLVIYLLAPWLANTQQDKSLILSLIHIYIFAIPFISIQGSFVAVLNVFKKFKLIAMIQVANSISMFIILTIMVSQGLRQVMWGYVMASLVTFIFWVLPSVYIILKRFDAYKGENYLQAFKSFYGLAFHTSLTASIKSIFGNIDILLLGVFASPVSVSFYKLALSATSILTLPVAPLKTTILPELNEAWANNNRKRVMSLIKNFVIYSLIITLLLGTILFISADFLVKGIYGSEFLPVSNLIRILLINVLISTSMLWGRSILVVGNKPQLLTYSLLIPTIIQVIMLLILIPPYGASGAAITLVIVQLSGLVLNVFFIMPSIGLWESPAKRLRRR